jgi:hypothetical protein
MMPHIRLVRTVARAETRCCWCPWVIAPLSSVYSPTIGGVALGRYCSHDHAERSVTAPVELAYV